MKEIILESVRKGLCKPFTVFLVALVLSTQILVIVNLHNRYSDGQNEAAKSGAKLMSQNDRQHKLPTSTTLKPLKVDMARFEIEVLKPHKDMLKKFPKHPDMVISKLFKVIRKEENRFRT